MFNFPYLLTSIYYFYLTDDNTDKGEQENYDGQMVAGDQVARIS
jgi:hypothetical protein